MCVGTVIVRRGVRRCEEAGRAPFVTQEYDFITAKISN